MKGPKVWKDPSKEEQVGGRALELCGRGGTDPRTQREEDRSPFGPFWGWEEKVTMCPGRGESGCSTVRGRGDPE